MTRINIYGTSEYPEDRVLLGWFDPASAECFEQDKRWDGSNMVGVITGSQWVDEYLYRTKGGRWVLNQDAHRYRNGPNTYEFLTDEQARDWLLRSECNDEAIQRFFGEIEDERGPGRPEVGAPVHVRLGDDLLGQLDAYAKENDLNRAEAVRIGLGEFLTAKQPYTTTIRDIATGQREIHSRHSSLGAAVEMLRDLEHDDYEAQQYRGLPSCRPRVEHDGRPVNVEAKA